MSANFETNLLTKFAIPKKFLTASQDSGLLRDVTALIFSGSTSMPFREKMKPTNLNLSWRFEVRLSLLSLDSTE